MEEKKKLLESHKELLHIKRMAIYNAQDDFQATLNRIATELGIDLSKNQKWRLDRTGEFLECIEQPQKKIPKGKK